MYMMMMMMMHMQASNEATFFVNAGYYIQQLYSLPCYGLCPQMVVIIVVIIANLKVFAGGKCDNFRNNLRVLRLLKSRSLCQDQGKALAIKPD